MNSIQNRALFTFVQYAEILSTTWLAARVISKYFWQFAYSFSLRHEIFLKEGRVKPSASSLFIEFEFHLVSNCRVWACIKLEFCLNISSFGWVIRVFQLFSSSSLAKFEFWGLKLVEFSSFDFRVAHSSTTKKYQNQISYRKS